MKIAVIGLGKIGLPLAAQFAEAGHDVVGVDVNEQTVRLVNEGTEPFPGEHDLQAYLQRNVTAGRLRAVSDYSAAVPHVEVVVVVVPLFVDGDGAPDFSIMDSATGEIASNLRPGTLIIYETTLPVGTTRNRWQPMLEAGSGLQEGTDFDVVFSPERVLTGRVFADLRKYPKLVGGLTPQGAARAQEFYEQVLTFEERPDLDRPNGVWDLGSAEASELAKLAETTYRDVNIGLANQFAVFADQHGIDVRAVIDASNSQPFSHIHQPGISVGGHCIPVYPRLYLHKDPHASVVRMAREYNDTMPRRAAELLRERYGGDLQGAKVTVLGAAYRGGVKETAFSGVFPLVAALTDMRAVVRVHDPLYSDDEIRGMGFVPYKLGSSSNAAIVHTDHADYRHLTSDDLPGVSVIVDGRAVLAREQFETHISLVRLGKGD